MVEEGVCVSLKKDETALDLIYYNMTPDQKRSLSTDTARTIIKSYYSGKENASNELYQDAIEALDSQ